MPFTTEDLIEMLINKGCIPLEKHEPSRDLEAQIKEHRGIYGKMCKYVRCTTNTPDYGYLSKEELDYYLYFRDCFMNGKPVKGDSGYCWLLLVELINDRDNPEQVIEHIRDYYHSCVYEHNGFPSRDIGSTVLFDYAAVNGLPIPRDVVYDTFWGWILFADLFTPVMGPIPPECMFLVASSDAYSKLDDDEMEEVLELFNKALPAVDARYHEITGCGLIDTFSVGRKVEIKTLFTCPSVPDYYLPYFYERGLTVGYTGFERSIGVFLNAMYTYCWRVIAKDEGWKVPSAPEVFTNGLRKAVDGIYEGTVSVPYLPKESGVTLELSDIAPMLVPPPDNSKCNISSGFRDSLKTLHQTESLGPCEYVSSKSCHPDLAKLPWQCIDYYLFWRDCARKGQYRTTDRGYIWFYLCELINEETDRDAVLEQLKGLDNAYGEYFDYFDEFSPARTYCDYAYQYYDHIPDPGVYISSLSANDFMEQLLSGKNVPIYSSILLFLVDLNTDTKSGLVKWRLFDDSCANITSRCLRRIDSSLPKGIVGYCRIRRFPYSVSVFSNLKFYCRKDPPRFQGAADGVLEFMDNPSFRLSFTILVNAVLTAVRSRPKPIKPVSAFGIDISDIVSEETAAWFVRKTVPVAPLVLDKERIELAKSELDEVTGMLSAEECGDIHEPLRFEEDKRSVEGDPWESFAKRLSKS